MLSFLRPYLKSFFQTPNYPSYGRELVTVVTSILNFDFICENQTLLLLNYPQRGYFNVLIRTCWNISNIYVDI